MVARIEFEEEFCATPHNRAHEKVRHGFAGAFVTDIGCRSWMAHRRARTGRSRAAGLPSTPGGENATQRVRSGPEESKPRMTAMEVGSGGARRCGRCPCPAQASRGDRSDELARQGCGALLASPGRIGGCLPFHDAPAARAEHAARLSEAQVALREDRALPRRGPDSLSVSICDSISSAVMLYTSRTKHFQGRL